MTLLLFGMFILLGLQVHQVKATVITVGLTGSDYTTIQAAINAAQSGDVISVKAGTYNEQVIANKTVSIIGENRASTIINEPSEIGDVVIIQANGVLLSNFTINGYKRPEPTPPPSYWVNGNGILIDGYNNTSIMNVTLTNGGNSIGMQISDAFNTTLVDNYIHGNIRGVIFSSCTNITLINNDVRDNWGYDTDFWGTATKHGYGIYLDDCYNATLRGNIMRENADDFSIDGEELGHFLHDIDTSNTILDGTTRHIHYLINQHDKTIDFASYPDLACLALVNSSNIIVKDFDLVDNTPAVLLAYTNDSSVTNNTISWCTWALKVVHSFNNTITGNIFDQNNTHVMDIKYSINNTIANNVIKDNTGAGIQFTNSSQNIIANNNITGCPSGGITLFYSNNNTLLGNNVTNCGSWEGGIYFSYSCNNTMRNNKMQNNTLNFRVVAYFDTELAQFMHDVDPSNMVNGKHIYYLINHQNETVDPSTYPDAGYLALVNSTNITAKDLELEGMLIGYTNNSQLRQNTFDNYPESITIVKSSSNAITENNITRTGDGIQIYDHSANNTLSQNIITDVGSPCVETRYCENNTITENTLKDSDAGIRVDDSPNTIITHNTVANNTFEGIEVEFGSDFCTVAENNLIDHDNSIMIQGVTNCTIVKNNVTGSSFVGIRLESNAGNNTVSENRIRDSVHAGLYLEIMADNNTVVENDITNSSTYGIELWILASHNIIMNNNITDSGQDGFYLESGAYNFIMGNNITNSGRDGFHIEGSYITGYPEYFIPWASWYNNITLNNVTNSGRYGIYIDSANSTIYHNRFVNYTTAASSDPAMPNVWDDGYPSGGNYWSNFSATDLYSGVNQNILGGDCIADSPFTMNDNNTDHYPLLLTAPYTITIEAKFGTDNVNVIVAITKDGVSSGQNTTGAFTNQFGTHTITVPSVDSNGHPFKQWNTGETSTTITISASGTYIAYYEEPVASQTLALPIIESLVIVIPIILAIIVFLVFRKKKTQQTKDT